MKNIMLLIKKIVLSAFVLYGYNLIAVNFNMIIPINYITVGLMTILGAPVLVALVLFKILVL
ncbi:unknown [Mycoplasma sp. CAG:877]|nr:unknown [Mycoplasma sp. CAG:877]